YMKWLYKYPQCAFPYEDLVKTNAARQSDKTLPEYELLDTGAFADNRYWDVFVEYAKASADDILIKITAANRGPDPATLDILPTLWFRNNWAWGYDDAGHSALRAISSPAPPVLGAGGASVSVIEAEYTDLGTWRLLCEDADELLFTENETNTQRLYGTPNATPYVKDAFHEYLIHGNHDVVNPAQTGTKAAARYARTVAPGQEVTLRLRLTDGVASAGMFGDGFDAVFAARLAEADAFYNSIGSPELSEDVRRVQRQSFAGMLWSKQFYKYDVTHWLDGDPAFPSPPAIRKTGRNHEWRHVNCADVISMPDTWEYPWFAAWDLAFHCIALAPVDAQFAKEQLLLLTHEWYQHPNGQLPAYEWAFGDVNPPVQAWAALRTFQIDRRIRGEADYVFLEKVFQKMLLTFTWWVNRKDFEGRNVFQGGFLGLDNIGVFDRSQPLPTGGYLEQSDGTSWMAMFSLNMLYIALELAKHDIAYEEMATKFFEHFVYIAHAMNNFGEKDEDLWDNDDGFYYDVLHRPDGSHQFLQVRSMVGLIPLLAVETISEDQYDGLPDFKARIEWFLAHRPELCRNVADMSMPGSKHRRLLSIVDPDRLRVILSKMLDEAEFLSPHGIRALSRYHKDHPFSLTVDGHEHRVDYEPAESTSGLFGGNSNWRGPIWFPLNYLLIEALQKFDFYLGPDFRVPFPSGSDNLLSLSQVAAELSRRLTRTFLKGDDGRRPVYGGTEVFQTDPHWRDLILFFEYFHGDNGAGLGASHQTGWTGLVGKLIEQSGE
ncbi:MAG: glucosidase, partial [Armatimonadota bacterium]|nr:glucosidase [Armatimonadota bacterium]